MDPVTEKPMAITFPSEFAGTILKIRARGSDGSLEEVTAYINRVEKIARETGCSKIFCDEREVVYGLNVIDTYDLAAFLAGKTDHEAMIGIVHHEAGSSEAKFYETTAVNRGIRVKMFLDPDEALAWQSGE